MGTPRAAASISLMPAAATPAQGTHEDGRRVPQRAQIRPVGDDLDAAPGETPHLRRGSAPGDDTTHIGNLGSHTGKDIADETDRGITIGRIGEMSDEEHRRSDRPGAGAGRSGSPIEPEGVGDVHRGCSSMLEPGGFIARHRDHPVDHSRGRCLEPVDATNPSASHQRAALARRPGRDQRLDIVSRVDRRAANRDRRAEDRVSPPALRTESHRATSSSPAGGRRRADPGRCWPPPRRAAR